MLQSRIKASLEIYKPLKGFSLYCTPLPAFDSKAAGIYLAKALSSFNEENGLNRLSYTGFED